MEYVVGDWHQSRALSSPLSLVQIIGALRVLV